MSAIEGKVPTWQLPASAVPESPKDLSMPQNSYLIGISAVFLLMSWLDFRIGSTLAGSHSNQIIWALWLLISVFLSFWLAITPKMTWLFAVCIAILRSLEKTTVMAYCWSKYGSSHATFIHELFNYSGLWTQIFLPEIYVFLSAFWLGTWLSHISHTRGINETPQGFDARVHRISALTSAIAPILTFLGAVLVAIITGMTGHR